MGFVESVTTCLRKYAVFSGRASRSEYWYFFLFLAPIYLAAAFIDTALRLPVVFDEMGPVGTVTILVVFLPCMAVSIRRLHDTGKSGWWCLLALVPVIGSSILFVWFCTRGEGPNIFGPDPLAGRAVAAPAPA